MIHPDLPDQPIRVREDAVPHHQAAGWQIADAPATPTKRPARRRRQQGDD